MSDTTDGWTHPDDASFRLVYETLRDRRAGYDGLMWQTPALGMTAQAFLMTIALGRDTSQVARLLASLLAFIIAVLSMQLMAKHRYHESMDARLLQMLEDDRHLGGILGIAPHAPPGERALLLEQRGGQKHQKRWPRLLSVWRRYGWRRYSSYLVWMGGLALFALTALVVMALALTNGGLLSG